MESFQFTALPSCAMCMMSTLQCAKYGPEANSIDILGTADRWSVYCTMAMNIEQLSSLFLFLVYAESQIYLFAIRERCAPLVHSPVANSIKYKLLENFQIQRLACTFKSKFIAARIRRYTFASHRS